MASILSTRSTGWLALVATAALGLGSGCATVHLAPGPDSATADRRVATPPSLDAASLATLTEAAAALRVPTGTPTPHPAFAADGRRVALHTEMDEAEHDHRVHQISVVDLRAGQIDIVHEWHEPAPNHDPYAYGNMGMGMGMGGVAVQGPTPNRTWHPAFFGDALIASTRGTAAPFDADTTQRLSPGAERADTFGTRGSWPVVAPNGRRVLLQTHEGIAEFDVGGSLVASHPGWEPVWAPDSRRFVSHQTPWNDPSSGWWNPGGTYGFPKDIEMPSERSGGLLLHDGDDVRLLTERGGDPAWLPDGERLVFSRPSADDPEANELVELRVSDGETSVIGVGSAPSVHPSGVLVAEQAGRLVVSGSASFGMWSDPVVLGIEGTMPRFSADGRWLVVAQRVARRGAPERAVDLVFFDLARLPTSDALAPGAGDEQGAGGGADAAEPAPDAGRRPQ